MLRMSPIGVGSSPLTRGAHLLSSTDWSLGAILHTALSVGEDKPMQVN